MLIASEDAIGTEGTFLLHDSTRASVRIAFERGAGSRMIDSRAAALARRRRASPLVTFVTLM